MQFIIQSVVWGDYSKVQSKKYTCLYLGMIKRLGWEDGDIIKEL